MTLLSAEWETLSKALKPEGHHLVAVDHNLVDLVWDDRPSPSSAPIMALAEKYTGLC